MEEHQVYKKARLAGRMLRFIVGALLIVASLPFLFNAETTFMLTTMTVVVLLFLIYSLVHFLVTKYTPHINPWLGAIVANGLVIAFFLLGGGMGFILGAGEGRLAVLIFVGLSLVIAAWRADAGCEVMSIPGLLFRRRTHLACLLFSPIDWLEEKLFWGATDTN